VLSESTALKDTAAPSSTDLHEAEGRLQGEGSMWAFVLGDLLIFGVYFVIFMVARAREQEVFLQSQQHLNQNIGVLNTLVLLASSWFVARGVQAARAGDHGRAMRLTSYGGACGVLFLLVKVFEWSTEISQGHTLASNGFFAFYFVLTGVHLLHVVMGLIVVGVVLRELRNPALCRVSVVETGAVYWHMVDLLWLAVFALLYVTR
jgi:nitric oxide reductase NorE protein